MDFAKPDAQGNKVGCKAQRHKLDAQGNKVRCTSWPDAQVRYTSWTHKSDA